MNTRFLVTPNGEELAVLPRAEYDEMIEAVARTRDVADYRAGYLPGLTPAETREYVEAPTPLSFWRKYRGFTQADLAARVKIGQGYLSDIENGKRAGPVELWLKLSRALDLPIEAIVDDADEAG
ncbi:MAG TPA: helix-turn-helix transcriptional regulator [Rhizobiaceae bacterium]|nr:helix-turn-helix transcriptional regulator [Rhizobiaceae bacterium]